MAKKKIYTVATSHLDTIWSWDFETTVSKYIYNTLVDNIALFKKYPTYTFSFEGSYRYELMEEYYPELFEEMKEYIKQGRLCLEIFFSAIPILMKNSAKGRLIFICQTASALAGRFRVLLITHILWALLRRNLPGAVLTVYRLISASGTV